ncbi:MAG: A/G-specific adenine glycosylase [Acidobacteria bacterium]|nr:A/G-specific adenine glycosylase [Acidobacteriota bacterium]MCI0722227.1 A/G-specific adenine glycosylase [Acidobacteriota bacterium]
MGSDLHEPRIHSEHRILWSSRGRAELPVRLRGLKGFFARYAGKHPRDFPWRKTGTEPFHLLLAELLLVQTKAHDVRRVWPRLVRRYHTPVCLARARREALIRFLQPLGLQRQRARALTVLARALVDFHDGKVPPTVRGLLSLPHVGLYVATAVSCFGFQQWVPIVDANVVRVFDRITGFRGTRDLRRRPDVWQLAWALVPRRRAARHNYGLLDFAAMTCTPRAPRCSTCSLSWVCAYGQQQPCVKAAG